MAPLLLLVASGVLIGFGASFDVGDPHTVRTGACVALVAFMWLAAEALSLGAFRAVALLALVASVLLLIRVGEDERRETEHRRFETETVSIAIELEALDDQARDAIRTAQESVDIAMDTNAFNERRLEAESYVGGCDRAADGERCEPRLARATLLAAFLEQLRVLATLVPSGDVSDAIDTRRAEVRDQIDALEEPVAVHRLVVDGADAVVGDIVDGLLEDEVSSRLGGWAWVFVAVLMVLVYRMLEIRNGQRYGGPIMVEADAPLEKNPDLAHTVQRLRMWLGAAELREPAQIPGGEATKQITSLVEDATQKGAIFDAVVKFFQATAFPKKGAVCCPSVEKLGSGADEVWRVAVRVSDLRTRRLLFVQSFEGDDLDDVCSDAAHFVAERVLADSRVSPAWSKWSSDDGSALRNYQHVLMKAQGPGEGLPEETRLELLRYAVSASPKTGVALVALGNEVSMKSDLVEALALHLHAGAAHSRMVVARYRAGVTASMLSTRMGGFADSPHRDLLTHIIQNTDPRLATRLRDDRNPVDQERAMLELAKKELEQGWGRPKRFTTLLDRPWRRQRGLWLSVWRARRQEERSYYLGLARSQRRRLLLHATILISLQLVQLRLDAARGEVPQARRAELKKRVDELRRTGDGEALVLYNAACFYSALAGSTPASEGTRDGLLEAASHFLPAARMARDGHTVTLAWAQEDPDLAVLRGSRHWVDAERRLEVIEGWADEPDDDADDTDGTDDGDDQPPDPTAQMRRARGRMRTRAVTTSPLAARFSRALMFLRLGAGPR